MNNSLKVYFCFSFRYCHFTILGSASCWIKKKDIFKDGEEKTVELIITYFFSLNTKVLLCNCFQSSKKIDKNKIKVEEKNKQKYPRKSPFREDKNT